MELVEELKALYRENSKHSNYQILPKELADLLELDEADIVSRYEMERFKFISDNLLLKGKSILDIGGNTGYFTFESIKKGCKYVDYYEGNKQHAEFVKKAKKIFGAEDRVLVHDEYYLFNDNEKKYDIVYCLNVVHHLGDDFYEVEDMMQAKIEMLTCINNLSYITDYMVFQMGFNWCGDRRRCLFENGTKEELETFLIEGTKNYWKIEQIGLAERHNEEIKYELLSPNNNHRIDEFGEFLNRPIFVMKSEK